MGAGCNPRVALRPPSSAPTCGPSGVLDSGGIERRVRERGGSPGASGGPPSPQGPGGRSHRRERGLLLLSSSIVPCLPDHPLQGPPAAVRPLYLPVRPQRGGGGVFLVGGGGAPRSRRRARALLTVLEKCGGCAGCCRTLVVLWSMQTVCRVSILLSRLAEPRGADELLCVYDGKSCYQRAPCNMQHVASYESPSYAIYVRTP